MKVLCACKITTDGKRYKYKIGNERAATRCSQTTQWRSFLWHCRSSEFSHFLNSPNRSPFNSVAVARISAILIAIGVGWALAPHLFIAPYTFSLRIYRNACCYSSQHCLFIVWNVSVLLYRRRLHSYWVFCVSLFPLSLAPSPSLASFHFRASSDCIVSLLQRGRRAQKRRNKGIFSHAILACASRRSFKWW